MSLRTVRAVEEPTKRKIESHCVSQIYFLANDLVWGNFSPICWKSGSLSRRLLANFLVSDLTASATPTLVDASFRACSTDVVGSTPEAEMASCNVSAMTLSTEPSGFSDAMMRRRFDGCVVR